MPVCVFESVLFNAFVSMFLAMKVITYPCTLTEHRKASGLEMFLINLSVCLSVCLSDSKTTNVGKAGFDHRCNVHTAQSNSNVSSLQVEHPTFNSEATITAPILRNTVRKTCTDVYILLLCRQSPHMSVTAPCTVRVLTALAETTATAALWAESAF